MKILMVSHYYPPHVGGLEIAVQNLTQSLVRAGHEVTLVTCATAGSVAEARSENGTTVHRVSALNFFDTHFNIPFPIPSPSIVGRLWRDVRHADIVHVHDVFYVTSWVAYICARLQKKPLFLTQHVALVEHPSRIVMMLEKVVYASWGRWIFSYAHRLIAHNATVKNFLAARADGRKVIELRNGIDRTMFYPAANAAEKKALRKHFNLPEQPLALFVGRFVPKKGIDSIFASRNEAYDLVFAGSGETKHEWKRAKGVHVLGALSQGELAQLYRACDVCVLPSRGELFTLALQEAAASGLPVITTDEAAYAAYDLDRTGIMLIEPSPANITASIKKVLSDTKLRKKMSAYSIDLAARWFDLAQNSGKLIDVYTEFENGRRIVTTSWDDGHVLDVQLATLLKKYGITGTFYLSPENQEFPSEKLLHQSDLAALSGFEIGAHTVTHPFLPHVSADAARTEIVSSKAIIEKWTGKEVASFCYPKGGYTKVHENIVRDASYKLARTTERFSLGLGTDPYALPTTIHAYDHWSDVWNLAKFVRFNPFTFMRLYRKWDEQAIALFDEMLKKGGVFHLWGHSWEIDQRQDWGRLERVLKHIANREGVKYVTNEAVLV